MKITLNGEPRDVPEDASVADAVAAVTAAPSGVAAALNDEVVARSAWAATRLNEADRLEVLTAVQGG
ncbi:sulfur carrier protein ThiS [Actinomadura gamaensis]|uniref:Sulfur carrier protein ThiS n=1 Tax=Actinomadura gamaensis TaxID=1763541 RepID=A0ABV9TXN9_9ACTN